MRRNTNPQDYKPIALWVSLSDGEVALDAKVLQTEVAFHPSEVPFGVGPRDYQVSPSAAKREERVDQEALSPWTAVWAGFGTHDQDTQVIQEHHRREPDA
jgi:hypothetical protein